MLAAVDLGGAGQALGLAAVAPYAVAAACGPAAPVSAITGCDDACGSGCKQIAGLGLQVGGCSWFGQQQGNGRPIFLCWHADLIRCAH